MRIFESLRNIFGKGRLTDSSEVIRCGNPNIILARHIIHNVLPKSLDGDGIRKNSTKHVHFVVVGSDSLMIHIARQAMLHCHFPNFDDERGENRTKITIITELGISDADKFRADLDRELGNMLSFCKWSMRNADGSKQIINDSPHKYIDIEVEIIYLNKSSAAEYIRKNIKDAADDIITIVYSKDSIGNNEHKDFSERYHQVVKIDPTVFNLTDNDLVINTKKAKLVNWVYSIGLNLTSIHHREMHKCELYKPFIDEYTTRIRSKSVEAEWSKLDDDLKFSNVLCSDGFNFRLRSIGVSPKSPVKKIESAIKQNIADLSRTEHSRWIIEKLLLGFRPLNEEETWHDETLNGQKLKNWRKELKTRKVHIDICSYRDLHRLDPISIKHDTFLMLAIPSILSQ